MASLGSILLRRVSWEALIYLTLIGIAGTMRFWDLGSRAMHHDESLHAFFSLDFVGSYKHNPLMHGPFQFFGMNLIYNLFGASDASARALAAAFGTALVGMPYFLRSRMGRWGSIVASVLIAFSPTLFYFSRFARNDAYMAVWTLGLIICAWRYLAEGRARYLYIGAALLSLLFATKENSYITLAILGSFMFLLWLRRPVFPSEGEAGGVGGAQGRFPARLRRPTSSLLRRLRWLRPYLVPSAVAFVLVAGWALSAVLWSLDIYDVFGRVDPTFSLISLGVVVGVYVASLPWLVLFEQHKGSMAGWLGGLWLRVPVPDRVRRMLRPSSLPPLSGPGALWLLFLLLPLPLFGAAAAFLQGPLGLTLANPNSLDGRDPYHKPGFADGTPVGDVSLAIAIGIVIYLLVISIAVGLKWDRRKFLISAVLFWGIFVLLYTTLFTNLGQGLGSGLWQSLGYWIAQQDVRRGGQPWYYYLILGGAYEFLALAVVLAAAVWCLFRTRAARMWGLWWAQGLVVAVSLLLLLSPFWMPEGAGSQLVVGSLLLLGVIVVLAGYATRFEHTFFGGRVFMVNAGLILLLGLNWDLPRILEVWDIGVLEKVWEARSILTALLLAGTLALVTLKSLGRGDRFTWFLIYWLGMSLALYSVAAEKMPWLMVHMALPLSLLAGRIVGQLIERVRWRPRLNLAWGLGVVGALAIGLLAFHSIRVSVEAAYGIGREGKGDIPIEMLVYTQTSPDITETLADINALAESSGLGANLRIIIDRTSGFEYPWRWYLRDYKNVSWPCYDSNPNDATCHPMEEPPDADVLILHYNNRASSSQFLSEYDEGRRIRHRAWFPEFETYRKGSGPLPAEGFFRSLVDAGSWKQWWDYFAYRKLAPDKPIGSEDAVVFFRKQGREARMESEPH